MSSKSPILNIPIEIITLITSNLPPKDYFSFLQTNGDLTYCLINSAIPLRYNSSPHPPVKESPSSGLARFSKDFSSYCYQKARENPNGCLSKTNLCYDNRTLLHHVVENSNGNPAVLKHLLTIYTKTHDLLDYADAYGLTPLHLAASSSAAICNVLLGAGANVNSQNTTGETPLFIAVGAGHADVVECLLDHGADPAVVEKGDGLTALQKAAMFGRKDLVECLRQKIDREQAGVCEEGECGDSEEGRGAYASLNQATSAEFMKTVSAMKSAGRNPFEVNEGGQILWAVISCWRNRSIGALMQDRIEDEESEENEEHDEETGKTRETGTNFRANMKKRAAEGDLEDERAWETDKKRRVAGKEEEICVYSWKQGNRTRR